MDDGSEVIARFPTPIAGPPHYTTASEVATLKFLRNVLHVPVPEILAYSTNATNPVGAEYILRTSIHILFFILLRSLLLQEPATDDSHNSPQRGLALLTS